MVSFSYVNQKKILTFIERNEPGGVHLLRSVNKEFRMTHKIIFSSIFILYS